MENRPKKIVLTGGPGGGKTTVSDLILREFQDDVILIPESATILYSGKFPRSSDAIMREAAQSAIYHLQQSLEFAYEKKYNEKLLFCDRGTLDCAIYWPYGQEHFFSKLNTNLEEELNRYDAVVFFESAAVGGGSISTGNSHRNESLSEAAILDAKLFEIWSQHSNFYHIKNEDSFLSKVSTAVDLLEQIVKDHVSGDREADSKCLSASL